jgi:hypothetical protein
MTYLNNPSIIPLIAFSFVLVFYLWYTFSTIYHFVRFGCGTKPKTLALVFFVGSFILFVISIYTYTQIDWSNILPMTPL